MDTPGFDPNSEDATFREIISGVRSIRPFARITGLLYLTCIPQVTFDDFDRKLIQLIRALSGPQFAPRVTFITTFWTATPGQAASYNHRLASLRRKWEDGVGARGFKTYQHGWEYNAFGGDIGVIIDWYINREEIARHAKEMVARNYSTPSIFALRIEEEMVANVPIHETDAGKLLGLPAPTPAPSRFTAGADTGARSSHNNTSSSHTDASNPEPPPVAHTSSNTNTTHEQAATPTLWTTAIQVGLEGASWLFRNFNPGTAARAAGPGRNMAGGDPFRGGGSEFPASFTIPFNIQLSECC